MEHFSVKKNCPGELAAKGPVSCGVKLRKKYFSGGFILYGKALQVIVCDYFTPLEQTASNCAFSAAVRILNTTSGGMGLNEELVPVTFCDFS